MERHDALRVIRLSPYHLVAKRRPITADDEELLKSSIRLFDNLIIELRRRSVRAQGPKPVIWNILADGLDPCSQPFEGSRLDAFTPGELEKLKLSVPPR